MPPILDFKGPVGLFLCLLTVCLGVAAQSPPQEPTCSLAGPDAVPYTVQDRPAPVPINSMQIDGKEVHRTPDIRPWSQRITPVAIHYPGIDLASGLYQDIAAERQNEFTDWLANKWMDRNAACNRIFQRDLRFYPWGGPPDEIVLQCRELNRPFKDLKPVCTAPQAENVPSATLLVSWSCALSADTVPLVYQETKPVPEEGDLALVVNPASGERSRIVVNTTSPNSTQGVSPNR